MRIFVKIYNSSWSINLVNLLILFAFFPFSNKAASTFSFLSSSQCCFWLASRKIKVLNISQIRSIKEQFVYEVNGKEMKTTCIKRTRLMFLLFLDFRWNPKSISSIYTPICVSFWIIFNKFFNGVTYQNNGSDIFPALHFFVTVTNVNLIYGVLIFCRWTFSEFPPQSRRVRKLCCISFSLLLLLLPLLLYWVRSSLYPTRGLMFCNL